jgi:hypothetical protein
MAVTLLTRIITQASLTITGVYSQWQEQYWKQRQTT